MTSARIFMVRFIPRGSFARNVALLAGGTGFGQAISALASPLLTRLYSPEDYGTLAVFAAILGIAAVIATFRYNMAIPLPEEDADAANVLVLCLCLVVITSAMTALLFGLLGDQISVWINAPGLRPIYWLLPLGVLALGTYNVLNFWAIRRKTFVHLGFTRVSQSLSMVLIQLGLGVLKITPLGLLLGQVVGQATGVSTLAILVWRKDAAAFMKVSLSGMRWAAKRYCRFLFYSAPAALLTTAWLQLPAMVLATFYGTQVAGWYALGHMVLGAPITLLGDSVGQVYLGESASLARERPEAMYGLFVRTAVRLFVLSAIPIGLIGLGGPDLFEYVFGPSWPEAGLYVQILAPMFILRFTVGPISQTLSVLLERQDLFLAVSVVRLFVTIGALLIACWLGAAPHVALAIYSGSMVFIYIGHLILMFYAFKKHMSRQ